jgi:sulfoxide reductase catalytic subunit YedY
MKLLATGAAGAALASWAARDARGADSPGPGKLAALSGGKSGVAGAITMEKPLTDYKDASTYNNFYEFGTDKADPARNAHTLKVSRVDGRSGRAGQEACQIHAGRPAQAQRSGGEDLPPALCGGVVHGHPLGGLLHERTDRKVEPLGNAKYVEFVTQADPKTMPFVGSRVLDWPYVEGLRMDEAMNPLTLLTFGMYGEVLPNQNGAPVRLVVPWKYGFKSGKSLVKIRFTDKEPKTAWNKAAAGIRLLLQREPQRRPSALEPGDRAPHW